MKKFYLSAAMTVSFLVACSDEGNTTTYVSEEIGTLNSQVQGELPACTADDKGKFFFMPGTKDVVHCSDGAWVPLAASSVSHKDTVGTASDTTIEKKGTESNLLAEEIESCEALYDSTNLHVVTLDCGSFNVVTYIEPDPNVFVITGKDIVDTRDSAVYRTIVIGNQTWLRDNISLDVEGSKECTYVRCGRLYTWAAAQDVCPEGTHLPTEEEFMTLEKFVDSVNGTAPVGRDLVAKDDNKYEYRGNDVFGFEAHATWPYGESRYWTATEDTNDVTKARYMKVTINNAYVATDVKTYQNVVRCIVDNL